MKCQHPLTYRLARWLYLHVDRYEYGIVDEDDSGEHPAHAISEERYRCTTFLSRLKMKMSHIDHHLTNRSYRDTCFYTSKPSAEYGLFCVDIDAHEGQQDAMDVAAWIIARYLPGSYYETSSGGLGQHLYFRAPLGFIKRPEINERLVILGSVLRGLVAHEGFESVVCGIYGNFSIKSRRWKVERSYASRGDLAKLPRPRTEDDLDQLRNMPFFNWDYLERLCDHAHDAGAVTIQKDKGKYVAHPTQPTTPTPPQVCAYLGGTVPLSPSSASFNNGYHPQSANGYRRKRWAFDSFLRQHHREPTLTEALEYYEATCLTTGPRDHVREKKMKRAIRDHLSWFDSSKARSSDFKSTHEYEPGAFSQLVKDAEIETDELRYQVAKNETRPLTLEDVETFIGIVTEIAFCDIDEKPDVNRAARKRILGYWKSLKEQKLVERGCNEKKYRGLRELCKAYQLLDIYDQHTPPIRKGGRRVEDGRGMLIGPGQCHPLYFEFMAQHTKQQDASRDVLQLNKAIGIG